MRSLNRLVGSQCYQLQRVRTQSPCRFLAQGGNALGAVASRTRAIVAAGLLPLGARDEVFGHHSLASVVVPFAKQELLPLGLRAVQRFFNAVLESTAPPDFKLHQPPAGWRQILFFVPVVGPSCGLPCGAMCRRLRRCCRRRRRAQPARPRNQPAALPAEVHLRIQRPGRLTCSTRTMESGSFA